MGFLSTLLALQPGQSGGPVDLLGTQRGVGPVDLLGDPRGVGAVDLLGSAPYTRLNAVDLTPRYTQSPGFVLKTKDAARSPNAPGSRPEGTTRVGAGANGVASAANLAAAFPELQPYGALLGQAVQETGVPLPIWMAAVMSESEGHANALNPFSLASGLLQALPTESPKGRGRGYGYTSEQLTDPALNLRLAHPEFREAYQATVHIPDPVERAVQTIARAQRYEDYENPQSPANVRVRGFVRRAYAAAPTMTMAATGGISQDELGLPQHIAAAFCGPAAAMWFTQTTGRTPTAVEALNLGRELEVWNERQGMATGPQGVVAMLGRLGAPARLAAPNLAAIAREVSEGRPVIVDTGGGPGNNGHYFQVTGYDPQTGKLRFGDAVGRRYGWVGLDEMARMGFGGARTAIHVGP